MTSTSLAGLRVRLLILVALVFIPVFGMLLHTLNSGRQQAMGAAVAKTTHFIHDAAREQTHLIENTRHVLSTLSLVPAVSDPRQTKTCERLLAGLLKEYPQYGNIGVAGLDGRVRCSAKPTPKTIQIADRLYYRRALETRDFVVGEYQVGRITGRSGLNFGYPLRDATGKVQGVIFAALDLGWLNELVANAELPPGATVTVVDHQGVVLARNTAAEQWVGKSARGVAIIETVLSARQGGSLETVGLDGTRRLFTHQPLLHGEAGNIYLYSGVPTSVIFADVERGFWTNLAILFAITLLVATAAWVGGAYFVLQPINTLSNAARRVGEGDLAARTGIAHGAGEIGMLAATFDEMAAKLERRSAELKASEASLRRTNRALRTLSAGNQSLVRVATEEQLLREMCEAIVKVGGYPLAWVGYAEHDEPKTIRPMAQLGLEPGHLEGLPLTWADTEHGRGPTGIAIRTGQPQIAHHLRTDPLYAAWHEEARRNGVDSAIVLPLRMDGNVMGSLSVYAAESDAFDDDEAKLLEEMADDLAFGIGALRTRIRHAEADKTIHRLAFFDTLTGLPNRTGFFKRFEEALTESQDNNAPLALLVLNIERFRDVNDTLGYQIGNVVLQHIGPRLRSVLPDSVEIGRLGGDEFAALLPGADAEQAMRTAEAVGTACTEPFIVNDDLSLDVHLCIGIALCPGHGSDVEQLLRRAALAMRRARQRGVDHLLYSPQPEEDNSRRLTLISELRHAPAKEELRLYCQPKALLADGRICGAEALLRWEHPTLGQISPGEFIPLAERTGLIKPLTDWVLGAALRQCHAWHQGGLEIPLAVNLSANNLHEPKLIERLQGMMATWGVKPEWLQLELTESALMQDPAGSLKTLTELHDLGIPLYIDDYGTGYSSLSYLQKLPVDGVKIDMSFIKDMMKNEDAAVIVRSTIDLAHTLGIRVVAEGVENEEIWKRLVQMGCDEAQGYYISKPFPTDTFSNWLRKNKWKPKKRALTHNAA